MYDFFNNDFTKSFAQFKLPKVDFSEFAAMQQKNIEAFTAANRVANETAQNAARRSAEFVRDSLEESMNITRELMTAKTPDENIKKQADFTKQSIQTGVERFREVSEMATKAQFEAYDLLNKRFNESLEEAKKFSEKQAKKAA
jgi:phasin family protein